jgi:CheY-like chemotaxis protein
LRIINDILVYSKIEAGKLELDRHTFDIEDMLEQLKVLFGEQFLDKGLALYFSLKNCPKTIIGDELKLTQVLVNLLGNALKFTKEGYVKLEIEKEDTSHDAVTLRFRVVDSGIGMDEEELKKIFTPFGQADNSTTRKFGGTGLGLSISKEIVAAMGGEISASSIKNGGSEFNFAITFEINKESDFKENPIKHLLVVAKEDKRRENIIENIKNLGWIYTSVIKEDDIINALENRGDFDFIVVDADIKMLRKIEKMIFVFGSNKSIPILFIQSKKKNQSSFYGSKNIKCIAQPLFPRVISQSISMHKPQETNAKDLAQPTVKSYDFSQLNILLVEDNAINQEVATAMLERQGATIYTADNGKEGAALYLNTPWKFDIILMDLQMPIMGGYEATKIIREVDNEVPIIALTAAAMIEDKQKALKEGMNDHLGKPIDREALYAMVAKYCLKEESVKDSKKSDKELVVLDEAHLSMLFKSSQKVYELMQTFKNQLLHGEYKEITSHIENNTKEAQKLNHSLKGVSGNLGAKQLFEICSHIDGKYKSMQKISPQDIQDLYQAIKGLLDRISTMPKPLG